MGAGKSTSEAPLPGSEVEIYGYDRQRQYNGKRGVVTGEVDGKVKVKLHDGGTVVVPPKRLRPAPFPSNSLPPTAVAGSFGPPTTGPAQNSRPPSTVGSLQRPPSSAGSVSALAVRQSPGPEQQFALIPSAIGTRHDIDSNGIPDVFEQPEGPPPVLINWKRPPPPVYEPGFRVEAKWKDELYDKPEWFPATVVQSNDAENIYIVRWDYNGELYRCQLEDIRKERQDKPWDWHGVARQQSEYAASFHHQSQPLPKDAFIANRAAVGYANPYGHPNPYGPSYGAQQPGHAPFAAQMPGQHGYPAQGPGVGLRQPPFQAQMPGQQPWRPMGPYWPPHR
mmetsp:Transcript_55091/g.101993  ORF Transcript_55091/g.101993 Transcript_55091/m.101993 type:complete len:336 (-) Transcript_55091:102-1109(-)